MSTRLSVACDLRGAFSLTKTATGILFKFSNIEDFQAVYKKGFHKVTGARFYKKVDAPHRRIPAAQLARCVYGIFGIHGIFTEIFRPTDK